MRILIISPGRLPVPAVRGGAVETLIESLLRYNEIEKKSTIDVVSLYDNSARKRSEKYKYSNFIFIKMGRWFLAASNRHILPYKFLDSVFSIKAQWGIKKEKVDSYDCIVIENEAINGWILQPFRKKPCTVFQTIDIHLLSAICGEKGTGTHSFHIFKTFYVKKIC